jgi:putative restriction endonuclease
MKSITSREELFTNIFQLERYRTESQGSDFEYYKTLVKRGTCFVPYLINEKICFAPSRFVGYENNNIDSHESNSAKDGRVTNEAINTVLATKPLNSPMLENAYKAFCDRLGVVANATGNFGVPRKYWVTDEIQAVLAEIAVAQVKKDPLLAAGTRTAIIQARVGQGIFREKLVTRWKGCAVTGCTLLSVLRASHIKPWAESTNEERLDEFNGLLLTANLDALFDKGLISFLDDGTMIKSDELGSSDIALLFDSWADKKIDLTSEHMVYLKYHRSNVFLGMENENPDDVR